MRCNISIFLESLQILLYIWIKNMSDTRTKLKPQRFLSLSSKIACFCFLRTIRPPHFLRIYCSDVNGNLCSCWLACVPSTHRSEWSKSDDTIRKSDNTYLLNFVADTTCIQPPSEDGQCSVHETICVWGAHDSRALKCDFISALCSARIWSVVNQWAG